MVLLPRLTICVVALRILVLWVCALLRKLVVGLSTRVSTLLGILSLLLLLLVVGSYLAMLKSTVCWRAVLLVVVLLFAAIVALGSVLLRWVCRLLIAALIIATLLGRICAVGLRGVLLIVLVVLIVRARHGECVEYAGVRNLRYCRCM
jgi:hypothetical protein